MLNNRALAASLSAGPKIYVEDVFNTYLYTGNGSSQRITNEIALALGAGINNTTASSIRSGSSLKDFLDSYFGVFNTVGPGEFLSVDLGQAGTVTAVTYKNNVGTDWAPTQVSVQSSNDGINWSTQVTYSDNATTNLQTISVTTGVAARYWRLFQNTATRRGTSGYEWHFGSFSLQVTQSGPGGLVWTKRRDAADDSRLFDTQSNSILSSSLTNSKLNGANNLVPTYVTFNSDGFSIPNDFGGWNTNTGTYASWTFRKAAKFFDVVTYTGNGVAGRAISHNLGSTPGCIIIKSTSGTRDWIVYHLSINGDGNGYVFLNQTTAASSLGGLVWGDGSNFIAPTSSTITVSSDVTVNQNGATYVAYLFAHEAGGFGDRGNDNVISCGSYTGNGSANGPEINLGWEPQWVLIKAATGSARNWFLFDTMRGLPVGSTASYLVPNTNSAEITGFFTIDPTPTGFKIRTTDSGANTTGDTYIYIAIRRGPMKTPTDATKVFNASAAVDNAGVVLNTGFPVDLMSYMLRTGNINNALTFDRLRGGSKFLATSSTNAENNSSVNFDRSDSIKVNVGGSQNSIYWSFRRAPGFFDVVAYTGTGSVRTVAHNLGVVPELIIVKSRSRAGEFWPVYHNGLGAMDVSYLFLNQDFAKAAYGSSTSYFSSTPPTNSVFGLGTDASVNFNTGTYIAYLFATCPGVSKVGSYTGSGTTKQIDCGFTNGARFVLIKRTNSTGDWYVWDTARGIVSANDPYLLLNSTAAEVTNTDYIDALSSGFEISSTAPAAINANGGSFIFLAIA